MPSSPKDSLRFERLDDKTDHATTSLARKPAGGGPDELDSRDRDRPMRRRKPSAVVAAIATADGA
jgi:hypothetical protein